ncbi:MAG TPA: sulfite exporter TauE/SafE family protein [Candidatus Bathyarchaeia archaeon]|nr:sulfite exporter TauE/SafE family protein [Candidatus Bathyarchaeia archaeon]
MNLLISTLSRAVGWRSETLLLVTPWQVLEIFLVSIAAGLVGALFGLGGGILIIPFLTLVEGVPLPFAIGASIVSVVATSSASAATYVHDHLTNLRLGMLLEVGTVAGAITGAYVAGLVPSSILFFLFALMLLYATVLMISGRKIDIPTNVIADSLARRFNLGGEYQDTSTGTRVMYNVMRIPHTLGISYLAGIVSGLLGVGGGIIKVPTLNLVSKVPVKVASATSNFMIGVTAAASASVYFLRGNVEALLVAPLVLGVVGGASIGTRLLRITPPMKIKVMFGILLAGISVVMILKAFNVATGL